MTTDAWVSIIEAVGYGDLCNDLCHDLGIDRLRLDDITRGITTAIAADPLSFDQVSDQDGVYAAGIRGFGIHPDLLVVYTYDLNRAVVTLHWIGTTDA